MGWFDVSLVLLKERKIPKSYLLDLHRKFETISLDLEIDNEEFIIFNFTRDEKEKEIRYLNHSMSVNDVIGALCEWSGLGLLSYRHPKFNFPITICYRTWDDKLLDGFTIGFNGHEGFSKRKEKNNS
ncbi:MAG: hypothetical protein SFU98_08755 [Leptospiraceae bacterium]|nr:hypothetical protein [Leptospiraceae bacterium]